MQAQRCPKIEPERLQECRSGVFTEATMRIHVHAKRMD
jgi:hypothetical protein